MSPAGSVPGNQLVREFFSIYPDYGLCRTLADNIAEEQTTHPDAIRFLSLKAQAAAENAEQIDQKLAAVSVSTKGGPVPLRTLGLADLMGLEAAPLKSVLEFYLKHPYAHGRCSRSRWRPALLRSFSLRVLVGHAKGRDIDLDYPAFFELLKLL